MAYESFWSAVSTNFSGTAAGGQVSVTSTFGFYVRQKVTVSGGASVTHGVVKDVLSSTVIRIGAEGGTYPGVSYDLSTFPSNSTIYAPFQPIFFEGNASPMQLAYENEPIKAIRVITVNPVGNLVDSSGAAGATTAGSFQFVKTAAATLTSGNATITSAFTAVTVSTTARIFTVLSSMDNAVGISVNGVQVSELSQNESFGYDLAGSGRVLNASSTIGLWNIGSVSTTGSVRIQIVS